MRLPLLDSGRLVSLFSARVFVAETQVLRSRGGKNGGLVLLGRASAFKPRCSLLSRRFHPRCPIHGAPISPLISPLISSASKTSYLVSCLASHLNFFSCFLSIPCFIPLSRLLSHLLSRLSPPFLSHLFSDVISSCPNRPHLLNTSSHLLPGRHASAVLAWGLGRAAATPTPTPTSVSNSSRGTAAARDRESGEAERAAARGGEGDGESDHDGLLVGTDRERSRTLSVASPTVAGGAIAAAQEAGTSAGVAETVPPRGGRTDGNGGGVGSEIEEGTGAAAGAAAAAPAAAAAAAGAFESPVTETVDVGVFPAAALVAGVFAIALCPEQPLAVVPGVRKRSRESNIRGRVDSPVDSPVDGYICICSSSHSRQRRPVSLLTFVPLQLFYFVVDSTSCAPFYGRTPFRC